ncbi:MAG: hypothetical protein M8866_04010 [marine benthic group bacterium]|nr:hypothetical protein [Candidatus Benthicola marisminoris]
MLMYSTCIFCNQSLGTNEAIEIFPIGRRISFDSAKGRLWVICRKCERWNLSPLEIRWEVIEECERLFRDTRLRVTTDNIGMAKLPEGLELVRLGKPMRGEFAAWRYGDQFGRRHKRSIMYTTAGVGAIGLVVVGGAALGASLGGAWYGYTQVIQGIMNERIASRLRHPETDEKIKVQLKHLEKSRFVPTGEPGEWELHVKYARGWSSGFSSGGGETLVYEGQDAMDVAGKLMARANRSGGNKQTIDKAVERIESVGDPESFLEEAVRESERLRREKAGDNPKKLAKATAGSLAKLPKDIRLAIEMATHEEAERRAMEGELEVLEAAWQNAEEIAGIADSLLLPTEVEEFVSAEKRGAAAEPRIIVPAGAGVSAPGERSEGGE